MRFDEPGDLSTVLRVLYPVFNEGYSGELDLADEAIRLTRQVRSMTDEAEVCGREDDVDIHALRKQDIAMPIFGGLIYPIEVSGADGPFTSGCRERRPDGGRTPGTCQRHWR